MACLSSLWRCLDNCYYKHIKQDPPQIIYNSQDNTCPVAAESKGQPQQGTSQQCKPYSSPVPLEPPSRLQELIQEQPAVTYRPHPTPQSRTEIQSAVGESKESQQLPLLEFSVFYDVQGQSLSVHLLRATNLPESRRKVTHPFVTVHLLPRSPDIVKSKALSNALDLEWNEKFTFSDLTFEKVHQQTLVFRVYSHSGLSRDDFLGEVVLPLADADVYGVPVQKTIEDSVIDFQMESAGDILLQLRYLPACKLIQGSVVKATNLMRQLRSHKSVRVRDPYIKVNILYRGKRVHKWKSSVKPDTLIPVFDRGESFQFGVTGLDLRAVVLQVVVMEHGWFYRDYHVGTILIGQDVEQETGRSHWAQVMGSLHAISLWHTLLPPL